MLARAYAGPGDEVLYRPLRLLWSTDRDPHLQRHAGRRARTQPDRRRRRACSSASARAPRWCSSPTRTTRPAPICRSRRSRRLHARLPSHVLLCSTGLCGVCAQERLRSGLELVATTPTTVVTRTFSKVYGLAALRVGWAYCPAAVADVLNRIRGPFNIIRAGASPPAPPRSATAPISRRASPATSAGFVGVTAALGNLGLRVPPSDANFVLVLFRPQPDAAPRPPTPA